MKSVIVTGSGGFIGRHLIKKLINQKTHVYALIRLNQTLRISPSPYLTVLMCDFENLSKIRDVILNDIDVFYHLAWSGVNGRERLDYDLQLKNIYYSIKCLEFADAIGCKKFIATGTITENLSEQIPLSNTTNENLIYGLAKMTSFNMLKIISNSLKIELIWAQLANVYGVDNFTGNLISYTISKLSNDEIAEFTAGELMFDFVYIDDVTEALILLGERFTRLSKYFIGSGKPRLLKDYLIAIGEIMNKDHLIMLGAKADSNLKYDSSWFSIDDLKNEHGYNPSSVFEQNIIELLKP